VTDVGLQLTSCSSVQRIGWDAGLATQRSRVRLPAVPLSGSNLGQVFRTHVPLLSSGVTHSVYGIIECIVVVLFCRFLLCMMFMCSVCLYFTVLIALVA